VGQDFSGVMVYSGDWKVYNPGGTPGGWAFEYANSWYPDVDDTAAVVLGLVKQDPASRNGDAVRRAAAWMASMQNRDGGWAAFDLDNDKEFLNQIPFSDMDSLCDPSPGACSRRSGSWGPRGTSRRAGAVSRTSAARRSVRGAGTGAGA
jgi:squalene cyclase